MTPESRKSSLLGNVSVNEYARNNRRAAVSIQLQGKHIFITIEELSGNGVFCWGLLVIRPQIRDYNIGTVIPDLTA